MLQNSGYDFGYLLKIVSCAPLPPTETEFFELLRIWFPCIWDIKVSMLSRVLTCAIIELTHVVAVPDEELQDAQGRTAGGGGRPRREWLPLPLASDRADTFAVSSIGFADRAATSSRLR